MKIILLTLAILLSIQSIKSFGRVPGQTCQKFRGFTDIHMLCAVGSTCVNGKCKISFPNKYLKHASTWKDDDEDTNMNQTEESDDFEFNGLSMVLALAFGVGIGYFLSHLKERKNLNAKINEEQFGLGRRELTRVN